MALYVNGQVVEDKQIQIEIERMRPEYERTFDQMDPVQREKQLVEWAKENVIEALLLTQEANLQIDAVTPETLDEATGQIIRQHGGREELDKALAKENTTFEQLCRDLEKQIRVRKLIEKIEGSAPQPAEKLVSRYYQDNLSRFTLPAMIRAAHIVRHPKPGISPEQAKAQMEEILTRLNSGEDFNKLAAEGSDCPDRGGDLGYFAPGQMVPAFEEVVFALKPGQISGVFETEFGFHIAKLIDKRPPMPVPLDQVRPMIQKELFKQAGQKALEKVIDDLRAKAVIEER